MTQQQFAHGDFETHSVVDLRKTGVHVYADDETTDAWCMSWAINDSDVHTWTPDTPGEIKELFDFLKYNNFIAHNAPFELAIWNKVMRRRYGWPELLPERTECTMAMAMALSLPASLEQLAHALKLGIEKDAEGHRLMMRMARPRRIEEDGTIVWWDVPERIERLISYCEQDVHVEREAHKRLLRLRPDEQKLWVLDQKINETGVPIDLDSVAAAIALEGDVKKERNRELQQITRRTVQSATSLTAMMAWVRLRGEQEGLPLLEDTTSLDKASIENLLSNDLPNDVRTVLEIRQQLGQTSVQKIKAMRLSSSADGRARALHQFHGASTGRWSGRRIQTQNLPRPSLKQDRIEEFFEIIGMGDRSLWVPLIDSTLGNPMDVLSDSLRGFICAKPHKLLLCSDFANIEGRVLAWLAGEEWKLDAYRAYDAGTGPDLYKVTAGVILSKKPDDITSLERQEIGKVAELAFGFGGGVGAWQNFSKDDRDDDEINDIKNAWRDQHPKIVELWHKLERAAKKAINKPGTITQAGPIKYCMRGSFLLCRLPNGRSIAYPYPKIRKKMMPWGEERPTIFFYGQDTYTRKWGDCDTYGAKLAENVTQAVARDILADALIRIDKHGYTIVMHVHDEIVAEEYENAAHLEDFMSVMAEVPGWAKGLPIAVDGWKGKRYRK